MSRTVKRRWIVLVHDRMDDETIIYGPWQTRERAVEVFESIDKHTAAVTLSSSARTGEDEGRARFTLAVLELEPWTGFRRLLRRMGLRA